MAEKELDFDYENFDFSDLDDTTDTLTVENVTNCSSVKKIRPKKLNNFVSAKMSHDFNMQSQFDSNVDIFLLDSPASSIGDITLQCYDDEYRQAKQKAEILNDDDEIDSADITDILKEYNLDEDLDEGDFIDPNAQYQAMGLSQAQLNEKYDQIEAKTLAMVKTMDLRLYRKNRLDLKKAIINDMMNKYFGEYQYVSKETQTRVASIVSIIVDHEINDLFARAGKRKQILFNQLRLRLMTFLQENVCAKINLNETQKQNYAKYILDVIIKKLIVNEARVKQYNPEEFDFVIEQTKAMINKTIDDRMIKRG